MRMCECMCVDYFLQFVHPNGQQTRTQRTHTHFCVVEWMPFILRAGLCGTLTPISLLHVFGLFGRRSRKMMSCAGGEMHYQSIRSLARARACTQQATTRWSTRCRSRAVSCATSISAFHTQASLFFANFVCHCMHV